MKGFEKIIGYENEKMELMRLCDTLKYRQKYLNLGVETPKALLIYGKPGVGKTLMAKTLIEESGRQSFSCKKDKPDGEFTTAITEVFEKAIKNQPSIVFLDDMDKFAEDNLVMNSNKEEFVTIQTLLEKIKEEDVFVIATANDIGALPQSLLRAGRFGNQIKVSVPTGKDAEKIISHYLQNKKIASDVNVNVISKILDNQSCAVLESVINDAGIKSAYSGETEIKMEHVKDAILKVTLKGLGHVESNPMQEKLIAYHEAGHAIMAILTGKQPEIVTIKKYGKVQGCCLNFSEKKRFQTLKDFKNEMMIGLAGKASTEIKFNQPDFGCEGDLNTIKKTIKEVIECWGVFGIKHINPTNEYGSQQWESYNERLFRKIIKLMNKWYKECKNLLIKNKKLLDRVAIELIKKKTLVLSDIEKLV